MSSAGSQSRWMLSLRLFFVTGMVIISVLLALDKSNVPSEQTIRQAAPIPTDLKPVAMSADWTAAASGNGQFAVDLKHPHRLIFEIANNPIAKKGDGGVDLTKVTKVRIIEIGDYHG